MIFAGELHIIINTICKISLSFVILNEVKMIRQREAAIGMAKVPCSLFNLRDEIS